MANTWMCRQVIYMKIKRMVFWLWISLILNISKDAFFSLSLLHILLYYVECSATDFSYIFSSNLMAKEDHTQEKMATY